jgi:hypothetical protein
VPGLLRRQAVIGKTPSLSLRLRIPLTRVIGILVRHLFGVCSVLVRLLFGVCSVRVR